MDNQKRAIYILLTQTGSLLNKTIQMYTDSPYNHVSISFDIGLEEVYSFGRKHPRNPLLGGFVREDVYYGVFRYFPKTTCKIFRLEVSLREWRRIRRIVNSFQSEQQIYRYNFIGLLGIVVNHPVEFRNAYFCSQFVAYVLQEGGINLWDKSPALVTPNDFMKQPSFELIYEGNLYDFPLLLAGELYQPFSFRNEYIYSPYRRIKQFIRG